jgi:hypothetical protein
MGGRAILMDGKRWGVVRWMDGWKDRLLSIGVDELDL